jgi:hypothetical protein
MRGDLEDQRLERLSKMHDTIRALKGLTDEEKKRVTRKLKAAMELAPATAPPTAIESAEPQIEVEVQADAADIIGLLLSSEEREPTHRSSEPAVRPAEQRSQPEETEKASVSAPVSLGSVQEEPASHPKEDAPEKEGESLEAIADTLTKLYKEYKDSASTFNGVLTSSEYSSATAGDVPIFLPVTPGPSADSPNDKRCVGGLSESISEEATGEEEQSTILRASKYQVELVGMESEAWSLLSSAASTSSPALRKDSTAPNDVLSPLPDQPMIGIPADQSKTISTADEKTTVEVVGTNPYPVVEMDTSKDDRDVSQPPQSAAPSTPGQLVEQAEETLYNVEQRSEAIAASYKRRTDAPTDRTYREAQSLLQAMGVPVVVTEGGEEAEAVASALVLEGSGHYVATEDTVSDPCSMKTSLTDWLGCPHSRCDNAP